MTTDGATQQPDGELTFEQALADLDKTVKALEAGGLTLSEATRLFEKGTKLARVCSEMLANGGAADISHPDRLRRTDAHAGRRRPAVFRVSAADAH